MESNDCFTVYEGMFSLNNVSEDELCNELSKCIKINGEEAKHLIENLEQISEVCNIVGELPHQNSGRIGFMVIVKKYNINISKIALAALAYILGLMPGFGLLTHIEFLKEGINAIVPLTDKQKAMVIFLEKLSYNGKVELNLSYIRRIFKRYSNIQEEDSNNLGDVNRLLDDLCDKGIIEIRTEKIRVLSNIRVL
jgi:type I site-specific restriction-modification system, R (restriction) subunit and related helicases